VSAAGLVLFWFLTVLLWFCVDMKLWRGLMAGEDMSDNSSMIRLLLGWFFGSSLSLCSREYFNKSSF